MTGSDVTRSLARYLALALGESWEISSSFDEGSFARPFARLTASTPLASTSRGAHNVEHRRSYSVLAFPIEALTEHAAMLEAQRVEDVLVRAFSGPGVHAPSYSSRSNRGHPRLMPVYSYADVGPGRTGTGERARRAGLREGHRGSVDHVAGRPLR